MEDPIYEDLIDIISFDDFDFGKYYEGEQDLLKPRLEELGYRSIKFKDGERDSFGPLSRVCMATNSDGVRKLFIYG